MRRQAVFGLWLVLASGCGSDETHPKHEPDAGLASHGGDAGGPDAGSLDKGLVKGRVRYANGDSTGPLKLAIGDKEYVSDNRGVFEASDVKPGQREVGVRDPEKASSGQLTVSVNEKQAAQVDLVVIKPQVFALAAVEKESDVKDDASALALKVPAKVLRTKDGSTAKGAAKASYALVQAPGDIAAAPGGMRGKDDKGKDSVQLEAFGMVELRFYQGSDELDLNGTVDLSLPLGPNSFAQDQMVDVWAFDEMAGLWGKQSKAVVDKSVGDNGVAKLQTKQAAWLSVAAPIADPTCVSGQILDDKGDPIPNVSVNVVAVDAWATSTQVTGADGTFCASAKPSSSQTVSAFGFAGSTYYDFEQTVTTSAGPAMCGGSGCTDLGMLSSTPLFDVCKANVATGQDHVFVLSSGDTTLDAALEAALTGHGQTVTIGGAFAEFDGKVDLKPYDAIYLQANSNWAEGDMPLAGQRQLINWVNCGGGLVTAEWTTWKIGNGGFQFIDAIFPVTRTSDYGSTPTETYSKVTADKTLNAGLPSSFTFTTDNFGGTESNLNPRPGATIYYDSGMLDSGLIGWSFNLGRVASLSVIGGSNEIMDKNFSRLLSNTVSWVQRK